MGPGKMAAILQKTFSYAFPGWKCSNFEWNFIPERPTENRFAMVQKMARHLIGNKPLPAPVITKVSIWRHMMSPGRNHWADSRLAASRWETLQSNAVFHWLGAKLESALNHFKSKRSWKFLANNVCRHLADTLTSLSRQKYVAKSFWCKNDVIIASRAHVVHGLISEPTPTCWEQSKCMLIKSNYIVNAFSHWMRPCSSVILGYRKRNRIILALSTVVIR